MYGHYGLVSAELLKAMNECTNPTRAGFRGVNFDGPFQDMPPITQLKDLTMLELSRCRFPLLKIVPLTIFLSTLCRLTYVGITYAATNIGDLTNKIMLKCPSLTHLDLEGNDDLRCRGFRNVRSCKMLKVLDISYTKELGSKALRYVVEGCPNLQHLDVSGVAVEGSMFRQILRCRNLKTLFMKDCNLDCIRPKLMSANIPSLQRLYTGPDFQLRSEVLTELRQRMPNFVISVCSVVRPRKEYTHLKSQHISGLL